MEENSIYLLNVHMLCNNINTHIGGVDSVDISIANARFLYRRDLKEPGLQKFEKL